MITSNIIVMIVSWRTNLLMTIYISHNKFISLIKFFIKACQYCKEFIEHFERTYPYKSSIRAKIQRFTKDALYNFICRNVDELRENQVIIFLKNFFEINLYHMITTNMHGHLLVDKLINDLIYNLLQLFIGYHDYKFKMNI